MVVDLPYASGFDVAGNRRTSRRGLCARRERQPNALCIHRARGSDHRSGRADVFFERKGWLERDHLGLGWNWMDCLGDHDLWRMESFTRCVWCLSLRVVAVARACASTEPSEYSLASPAGRTVSINDPDIVTGKHW